MKKNNKINLSSDQPTNVTTPTPTTNIPPFATNAANANANANLATLYSTLAQILKN